MDNNNTEEKKYRNFNLRLPEDTWEFLKEKSYKERTSMTKIIEKAVNQMKESEKK